MCQHGEDLATFALARQPFAQSQSANRLRQVRGLLRPAKEQVAGPEARVQRVGVDEPVSAGAASTQTLQRAGHHPARHAPLLDRQFSQRRQSRPVENPAVLFQPHFVPMVHVRNGPAGLADRPRLHADLVESLRLSGQADLAAEKGTVGREESSGSVSQVGRHFALNRGEALFVGSSGLGRLLLGRRLARPVLLLPGAVGRRLDRALGPLPVHGHTSGLRAGHVEAKAVVNFDVVQQDGRASTAAGQHSRLGQQFDSHRCGQNRHAAVAVVQQKRVAFRVETRLDHQQTVCGPVVSQVRQGQFGQQTANRLRRPFLRRVRRAGQREQLRLVDDQHLRLGQARRQFVQQVSDAFQRRHEGQVAGAESHSAFGPSGHAHFVPRWPMKAHRPTLRPFRSQPTTHFAQQFGRGRVVGLPEASEPSAGRAERNEVAQWVVGRQFNQRRRAADLHGQGPLDRLPLLPLEPTSRLDPRAVNDSFDRAVGATNLLQHGGQSVAVGDVAAVVGGLHAGLSEPVERPVDFNGPPNPLPRLGRNLAGSQCLGRHASLELAELLVGVVSPRGVNVWPRGGAEQVQSQPQPSSQLQRDDRRNAPSSARDDPHATARQDRLRQRRRRLRHRTNHHSPAASPPHFDLPVARRQLTPDCLGHRVRRVLRRRVDHLDGHLRELTTHALQQAGQTGRPHFAVRAAQPEVAPQRRDGHQAGTLHQPALDHLPHPLLTHPVRRQEPPDRLGGPVGRAAPVGRGVGHEEKVRSGLLPPELLQFADGRVGVVRLDNSLDPCSGPAQPRAQSVGRSALSEHDHVAGPLNRAA